MALSAITDGKTEFGSLGNLTLASTNVNSREKKNDILVSASKKGIFDNG